MANTKYAIPGFLKTQALTEPQGFLHTVDFNSSTYGVGTSGVVDYATGNTATAMTALQLLTGDSIALAKIPKGAVIINWFLFVPDLDSGTSLQLDLGLDATNSTTAGLKGGTAAVSLAPCLFTASTVGQAGGYISPLIKGSITLTSPVASGAAVPTGQVGVPLAPVIADCVLQLKVTSTAASSGAGSGGYLAGYVQYHVLGDVW